MLNPHESGIMIQNGTGYQNHPVIGLLSHPGSTVCPGHKARWLPEGCSRVSLVSWSDFRDDTSGWAEDRGTNQMRELGRTHWWAQGLCRCEFRLMFWLKVYAFDPPALKGLLHCLPSMFIPACKSMVTLCRPGQPTRPGETSFTPGWLQTSHRANLQIFWSDEKLFGSPQFIVVFIIYYMMVQILPALNVK